MNSSTPPRGTDICVVLGQEKPSTYSSKYTSGRASAGNFLRLVTKAMSDRLLAHYKWLILGLQELENTSADWQAASNIGSGYDRNWSASSLGLKTPRSVIMPVINSAGVTSNAGL